MQRIDHFVGLVHQFAVGVAKLVLVVLAVLTFVDVIGRYILSSPVPGTVELTEVLMALLMFGALASATRSDEHVRVELLVHNAGARVRSVLKKLGDVAVVLIAIAIFWSYFEHSHFQMETGDLTPVLRLPLYPFSIGAAILSACCLVIALRILFTKPSGHEFEEEHLHE